MPSLNEQADTQTHTHICMHHAFGVSQQSYANCNVDGNSKSIFMEHLINSTNTIN